MQALERDQLAAAVEKLTVVLEQLLTQNQAPAQNEITLQQAAQLLGVHQQTIHTYRRSFWTAGVHYFPQGKGHLYNRELLLDWQRNRQDEAQHKLAIAAWIQRNQPKKR
ncbi:MAG: helix-turn-helix domain-containing protein [Thermosynechococcaceae cyanobacterium MS004]|nr:helix-turn-helix domain-containing protein [Thermosynechococcaceae cyanobacterium MS004]